MLLYPVYTLLFSDAAAFGIFQLTTVVADARLQDGITGPGRATVTSLAGMSMDVVTLVMYGSYAALAEIGGHPGAFAILMLPYVLVAVVLPASSWRRAARRVLRAEVRPHSRTYTQLEHPVTFSLGAIASGVSRLTRTGSRRRRAASRDRSDSAPPVARFPSHSRR